MANTPNFNWVLPIVGNTAFQWGNYLNTIFGQQDSLIRVLANTAISNTAPSYIQAGTQWINNTSNPWAYSIYDGTNWVLLGNIDSVAHKWIPYPQSQAPTVTQLTTSGSFTPTSGMIYAVVEFIGSGAGGAGVQTITGNSPALGGGGGGSGGYAKVVFTAAQFGTNPITVTIGAAGTGGAGNSPGGNAGASSFGTLIVETPATGGSAASSAPANVLIIQGTSGTMAVSTGTSIPYTSPSLSNEYSAYTFSVVLGSNTYTSYYIQSGAGGNSFYGAGGAAIRTSYVNAGTLGYNGNNGQSPGGGGGGAVISTSPTLTGSYTGGNGASGICIITQYFV